LTFGNPERSYPNPPIQIREKLSGFLVSVVFFILETIILKLVVGEWMTDVIWNLV
jgi:hypothetical protein